jgi:hypothetical protein
MTTAAGHSASRGRGGQVMPLQHRRCETCAWYSDNSECRRWPPSIGRERQTTYGPWPTVLHDDWCGEWRLAAEAGEVEAMMRAIAMMDGDGQPFETYTDKGRRHLKAMATLWLSAMRESGLVVIIVPRDANDG